MSFPWLTTLLVLPLVGALVVSLLPKGSALVRPVALGTARIVVTACAKVEPDAMWTLPSPSRLSPLGPSPTRSATAEALSSAGAAGLSRKVCSRHSSPAPTQLGISKEWSSGQTKGCGISTCDNTKQ